MSIVKPMDAQAIAKLRAKMKGHKGYKPSAQALINQGRASKVYPHRLITPVGTGNDKEFSPFYGEGK